MKNLKKKIAALGVGLAVMASSVMSMTASAWEQVSWPASFTPYTGKAYANDTIAQVLDMKWSMDQISYFSALLPVSIGGVYGLEFEFSPSIDKSQLWASKGSTSSNMPDAYFEFQAWDPDDVTIGCRNVKNLFYTSSYYGTMHMTAGPVHTSTQRYTFSTELGQSVFPFNYIDYLPMYEAYYNNNSGYNANFWQYCTW